MDYPNSFLVEVSILDGIRNILASFLVEVSILGGTWTVLTERLHVEVIIMVSTRVILIALSSFSNSLQKHVETLSQLGHDVSLRNHLPIVLPSTLFSLRY
jgi:hypothetical protein